MRAARICHTVRAPLRHAVAKQRSEHSQFPKTAC